LLLANLSDDNERSARWSSALCRYAIDKNAKNADALQMWVTKWAPAADAAAKSVAEMLATHPEVKADAKKAVAAAKTARTKMLESSGLAGAKK
jgi:hypothetical protein